MNQEEVFNLMQSSRSEDEWNANVDKVKEACNGYPDFWYGAIIASGLAEATARAFGGSTKIGVALISQKPITIRGRPTSMPSLQKDERVVGVYDQGLGEKMGVCNSLEEMQDLYDAYARGLAITLKWVIASNTTS